MIGREKEIKELQRIYERKHADLVAVYGRRRVGKTFLIDNVFKDKMAFRHVGLSPSDDESKGQLKNQLNHFCHSLRSAGYENAKVPETWLEAFFMLQQLLERKEKGSEKLVVFLDELPWLDTARSGFIPAFEGFWNGWACQKDNILVIVCGSANSWIQNKIINSHGGLYNRVTYEMKLSPFTLKECEEFYKSNGVAMSRYDIAQSYMILGGVPYYLGYINRELSLAQNIDNMFFSRNAVLQGEYDRLFSSLFTAPERIERIVQLLSSRSRGYTRKEIAESLKITDGGNLSKNLDALVSSDFVIKYVPFECKKTEAHYKLIDPFCLFYLHFMKNKEAFNESFWQQNASTPSIASWRGYAFENVCFNHIEELKRALGVSGVLSKNSAWTCLDADGKSNQIDLLICRNDNIINMCEIKFYNDDFKVDKDYYRVILRRQNMLAEHISRKFSTHSTLITTFGLLRNEYSNAFVNVIALDDLFV